MSHDPAYYAARALEERRLAMASADPKVRRIHLEMAATYALQAGAGPTFDEQDAASDQQQDVSRSALEHKA